MPHGRRPRIRAAGAPDPQQAEVHWAEYRSGGPGADAAFRTLLAWYGLAVYRRVWGFVRSTAADDVFQDVLAGLHRRRARLDTWADAHRWLRATAIQTALAAHRRETRRKAREARRAIRPDDADGDGGVVQAAIQGELLAALAKLPTAERQVVALIFFEGMSATEAARVLGRDRETVAAWRDVALGRLRKLLPAAGVTVGAGSAGVEGVLAAGRPVVSSLRLGELARSAWTRAVPGPLLGKAAAVLVAGLTLGGVGLAGWALVPAPTTEAADPPKPARVVANATAPVTYQDELLRKFRDIEPRVLAALRRLLVGEGGRVDLDVVAQGSRLDVQAKVRHGRPHQEVVTTIALSRDTRFAGNTFIAWDWFNSGWQENYHPRLFHRKLFGMQLPYVVSEAVEDGPGDRRLPVVSGEAREALAEAEAAMNSVPADPRAAAEQRRARDAFRAAVAPLVGDWNVVGHHSIHGPLWPDRWNGALYLELPEAEDPALIVHWYDRAVPVEWRQALLDAAGRPTWHWYRWARVSADNARIDFPNPDGTAAASWTRPPAGK